MRITYLTFLAFGLNSALDSGKYSTVAYREVVDHIESGTIFAFLKDRLGEDIDLSLLDTPKQKVLLEEWQNLLNVADARRKFGVENNGLCLLVAYLLEGIQQRQDQNPRAGIEQ
jgi:hypothetical protein